MSKNIVYVLVQYPYGYDPREVIKSFQDLLTEAGVEHKYVPPKDYGSMHEMELSKAVISEHYLQTPLRMHPYHPIIQVGVDSMLIKPAVRQDAATGFNGAFISVIGQMDSGKTAIVKALGAQFETSYQMTEPFHEPVSLSLAPSPFVSDDELVKRLEAIKDRTSVVIGVRLQRTSTRLSELEKEFDLNNTYPENDIDVNVPRVNCFGQNNVFKGIAELFKAGFINEPQKNILSVCANRTREGNPLVSMQLIEVKEEDATHTRLAILVDGDTSVAFTIRSSFPC